MMKSKVDRELCIITLAAALALSGTTLLSPAKSARAADLTGTARAGLTPASTAAAPSVPSTSTPATDSKDALDDDDGDELLEHWSDPKYSHEERYQLCGMMAIFAATAGAMLRRKSILRRQFRG